MPHLHGPSDGAAYHKRQVDKAPMSNDPKEKIKEWLKSKGVAFDEGAFKRELLALVDEHRDTNRRYHVCDIAKAHGHEVLYTPAYHPELQPIELVWGQVKNKITECRTRMSGEEVTMQGLQELFRTYLEAIPARNYVSFWRKAIEREKKYLLDVVDSDDDLNQVVDEEEVVDDIAGETPVHDARSARSLARALTIYRNFENHNNFNCSSTVNDCRLRSDCGAIERDRRRTG